ncbi:MAG: NADH-quinone oxidoreductase subunit M [Alphaproteobacteria bacterium]
MNWPILSTVTFMPLVGALAIFFLLHGTEKKTAVPAQVIAMITSLTTFLLSLTMFEGFDPQNTGFQLIERFEWMPQFGISYFRGVDGISIWFVLISTFLTPICILSAVSGITKRTREFMIAMLVLETMMIGMFTALDFVLFYVFFEGVLIPMFLIVGVWGGAGRVYAAFKFFLYTFVGSVLMLVALIVMVVHAGTADMTMLMKQGYPVEMAQWLWLAFFVAFAVKTPMWPFHTWLPYAHVEAPTAGSVILAGVLLKMGGYGLIRVNMQMLPDASHYFMPLVLVMSVVAIIYTSLVALVQSDMKKLIAYSSVAHMGFVTLGIFLGNVQGLEGAMYVMLSHTLVSGALFLCVGVVYDRLHTREIGRYGGLANNMPRYAMVFMIFMLASIGMPGTSGFIGEFLSMQGAFLFNGYVAALAAVGTVLGAAYMLWLYRRVFYGPSVNEDAAAMSDLTCREYIIFIPLIALILWMGIYPAQIKHIMGPTIAKAVREYQAAPSVQEVRP